MRVIWYTAMSMDGRIASADDSLDFLSTLTPTPNDADAAADFPSFLATIDAVVVGASTFRWLLDGGHGWPHGDLPTWLFTHDSVLVDRLAEAPAVPIQQRAGAVEPVFAEIAATGAEIVWLCGGGDLAGQALVANLVDEVRVTIAPTVLGSGPALFEALDLPQRAFRLTELRRYAEHGARLTWEPIR